MSDPAVLFVKPNAISNRDKKVLRQAGVLVIEIENPADAKFTRACVELDGNDLIVAACNAINGSTLASVRDHFARAICAAVLARQKSKS